MTPKKVFYMMIGAVSLVTVLAISGIVIANSLISGKASKLMDLKLESRLLEEQQKALVQANKDIKKYEELDRVAQAIVPQDKDQARTVREIVNLAAQTGVTISSITFPSSTLGQRPAAPASGTPAPAATPASPLTQVKPVEGISGLYQLEVQIMVDKGTSYAQLINFLEKLEQNRRTAQITNLNITPIPSTRDALKFDLKMNVFIKP